MFGEKFVLKQNIAWSVLALLLLLIAILRAVKIGFVHDECLTFTIVQGNPFWAKTANHHLLNSFLTWLAYVFFGNHEFALRVPNLLAFVAYLYFTWKWSEEVRTPFFVIGAAILLLNSFAFEFFSLSRGYGLGLALALGSLYYWAKSQRDLGHWNNIILAMTLGVGAVYANFSYLHLWLASTAAGLVLIAREKGVNFFLKGQAKLLLLPLLLLIPALINLFGLIKHKQLYFGGDNGIIKDTLTSLTSCSLYEFDWQNPSGNAIILAWIILLLLVFGGVFSLYFFIRRKNHVFQLVGLTGMGVLLLPILLHGLFGTKYPVERAALYFIPVWGLLVPIFFQQISCSRKTAMIAAATLCLPFCFIFLKNLNFRYALTWEYDENTQQIIELIKLDSSNKPTVRLWAGAVFEPALNYYREKAEWSQLAPVTRDSLKAGIYDYYYGYQDKLEGLPNVDVIQVFSGIKRDRVLLKNLQQ